MKFGQKLQEFVYFLTTNDKYSEFDSRKSFNRINKPDSENLLGHHHNNSSLELVSHTNDDTSLAKNSNNSNNNLQGIHEVNLAWRHIKNWLHKYSPDLNNSLQSKCTDSDLQDFQKDLSIKLPNCVIQYFKLVDGQYSDFESSGLIFGLKLMSLDEITTATENWRRVAGHLNEELKQNFKSGLTKLPSSHSNSNQLTRKFTSTSNNADTSLNSIGAINDIDMANIGQDPISTRSSIDISTTTSRTSSTHSTNTATSMGYNSNIPPLTKKRGMNIPKQRSIPPNFIRETFAHPMWIPLITDGVGNYIGIDLSPASEGLLGQVILFGRDFDFKFQISDNWGDFLLIFANDLELGNWDLKQDQKNNDGDLFVGNEGDLVFIDKSSGLEVPYFEILKTRSVKKWLDNLQKSTPETDSNEQQQQQQQQHEQLLDELKNSQVSILTLSNKKFQSIDSFINNNLTLIDSMKKSELEGKTTITTNNKTKLSSPSLPVTFTNNASKIKSPLSQDVTEIILEGGEEEEEKDATNKKSTQPAPRPTTTTTTTTTKTNIDQTLEEVDL